ncbi:hypothetical protein VP01_11006g1, partial [Puccinia sorghi]
MRRKEPTQTKAPGNKWTEVPPVSNNWEKKLDAITKQLAAFTSQKGVPPYMKEVQEPVPFREPSFKFYYCFQKNHRSNRCSILSLEKSSVSVKRIWKAYFLPDNTKIPCDTPRPIKNFVDSFTKKLNLVELSTSFGKIEDLPSQGHRVYEVDLGKKTRSGR